MTNDVFSIFNRFYVWVIGLLPSSPFVAAINAFSSVPYLSYLNWFFPVTEIIAILEAWLVAITVFYLYRMVMSYIHLIG